MAKEQKILEICNLTKMYGPHRGVLDLDLHVLEGEIMGFLGPNGAGKSTTIRCCLDLLNITSGNIKIFGLDSHKDSVEIRRRTGYLPGDFGLTPDLKVGSYLRYLLSLSNVKDDTKMKRLASALDLDIGRKTQDLSKGNRQKVGVVQAFMADQDLIILDEPTGGLDPLMQHNFYDLLKEEQANGKTIFMSSHVLAEVESVCDRVAIIKEGRLQIEERISTLQDKMGRVLEVEFRDPVKIEDFQMPGVKDLKADGNQLTMTVLENLDQVIKNIADHRIVNMNLGTFSLEELFLQYYNGTEGEPAKDTEETSVQEGTSSDEKEVEQ